MQVLLVSHYAIPHLGGIEVLVDDLASELARRGHQVTHVASAAVRDGEAMLEEPPSTGYSRVRVPALNLFESRWGVPYPVLGPSLIRVLRREIARADVVHAHGCLYAATLAALAIARRRRVATVLTEHVGHVPYENRLLDAAESAAIATLGRWSLRRTDAVVVYNETVRRLVARLAPAARAMWIDNGIDVELFRPPGPGERMRLREELGWDDRPRVLFVGRAVAKKGFDIALQALRAGEGAFVLAVAGHDLGSSEGGVESLGVLPRERLASIYRAADALLAPSRGEGLPVAVQEALASGMQVVASEDPGYSETLGVAGSAVTLMPADGVAMGRALVKILAESPVTGPASSGVELAHQRFSARRWAEAHERLYAEVADSGRTVASPGGAAVAFPPRRSSR